jgi:hypothetical protein
MTETAHPSDNRNDCPSGRGGLGERERAALERLLASVTSGSDDANRICRLCDPGVCGHPARCPVTQAAVH